LAPEKDPALLDELKSSSLIEADYFDDDEQQEDKIIEGKRYKITIKTAKKH